MNARASFGSVCRYGVVSCDYLNATFQVGTAKTILLPKPLVGVAYVYSYMASTGTTAISRKTFANLFGVSNKTIASRILSLQKKLD